MVSSMTCRLKSFYRFNDLRFNDLAFSGPTRAKQDARAEYEFDQTVSWSSSMLALA